jgi:ribosomal protein S18 acetylase RimI-like enzyme
VRLAHSEEAEVVHAIMRRAFAEYEGALPVPSGALGESVADVAAAMAHGGAVLAFVDGSDEPVGSARFECQPDALYVGRVAVLPAQRRRGVASAMMHFLEGLAPRLGREIVRIGVRQSLPSNVALYESLGYEVTSIDPHPGGPDHSLTMCKRVAVPDA